MSTTAHSSIDHHRLESNPKNAPPRLTKSPTLASRRDPPGSVTTYWSSNGANSVGSRPSAIRSFEPGKRRSEVPLVAGGWPVTNRAGMGMVPPFPSITATFSDTPTAITRTHGYRRLSAINQKTGRYDDGSSQDKPVAPLPRWEIQW